MLERNQIVKPVLATVADMKNLAVRWVMEVERRAGRTPVDVRNSSDVAADLHSGPRYIEVKAVSQSLQGSLLWLEGKQAEAARRNPDFYLYVVENTAQGDPRYFRLKILSGERLVRLLDAATVLSGDRLSRLVAKAKEKQATNPAA